MPFFSLNKIYMSRRHIVGLRIFRNKPALMGAIPVPVRVTKHSNVRIGSLGSIPRRDLKNMKE